MTRWKSLLAAASCLGLAGCGLLADLRQAEAPAAAPPRTARPDQAREVVLYALGLMETGYRFGGKNPEAGFDCSGMVNYVFENAVGRRLGESAADMARRGRPVEAAAAQPGDLVFFNSGDRPRSHVGIYIGDGRFIHAPSSGGRVRTDSLKTGWFAKRFEEARTYFD